MNGSDFYTAMSSLISGFNMDPTLFYQFLNIARIQRELARPFMYLRKLNNTQTVSAVSSTPLISPPSSSINLPSDFLMWSEDGKITFYDNNNQYEDYTEIPMYLQVQYLQESNRFFVDYANELIYFLGIIQKAYTAYLFYQADFGNITQNTTWVNIPQRFHMILALDVAAMYRLGVDYDDIQARNADSNHQQAEMLFKAMCAWDDTLQRSAVTNLDYSTLGDQSDFHNRKINM